MNAHAFEATVLATEAHTNATEGLDLLVRGAKRLLTDHGATDSWTKLTKMMIKAGGFEADKTIKIVEALTAAAVTIALAQEGN